MLIDWFTVAAQVVNFLVLVALLRWLLYRRIVEAMDRREEEIASRLREAAEKNKTAEALIREYEERRERLEEEREQILHRAHEEAEARRHERLAEIREEVEETRRQWGESLRREQADFLKDLRNGAGREAVELARALLGELAGVSLESRMAEKLAERLRASVGESAEAVAEMLRDHGGSVQVRSAFELPEAVREGLREVVASLAVPAGPDEAKAAAEASEGSAAGPAIEFATEPELVCGIEIEAGGRKIGWSIDEHLSGLAEAFADLVEKEARNRKKLRGAGDG